MVLLLHLMNAQLTIPVWIWLCDALLALTPLAAENISRYLGTGSLVVPLSLVVCMVVPLSSVRGLVILYSVVGSVGPRCCGQFFF